VSEVEKREREGKRRKARRSSLAVQTLPTDNTILSMVCSARLREEGG